MNAQERIEWLNARDPLHQWKNGQDIYCFHCEAVFKAEDVGEDGDDPCCPRCEGATPIDFFHLPWWREDLTLEASGSHRYIWLVNPIVATPGNPHLLPAHPSERRCGICGAPVSRCCC
jgi:hypothetical protein